MTSPQLKMFQNGKQQLEAERVEKNPSSEPVRSHGPVSLFFLDPSLQKCEGMNSCLRPLGMSETSPIESSQGQQFILSPKTP